MTNLTITRPDVREQTKITGPQDLESPTITVVDGLRITTRASEASILDGAATLFRLAGEEFGRMHELRELRVHDGRLHGTCPTPISIGAMVTIGWEDPSMVACRGVVAMSLPGSEGWFITVELDSALAA